MLQQLSWQLQQVTSFSVWTTAVMACAAFLFLREIAQSPGMAMFSVPIVMAGGILSTALFQHNMFVLSYEPNANVAAMAGIGAIAALFAMITVKWLWVLAHERWVAETKIQGVAPRTRRVR